MIPFCIILYSSSVIRRQTGSGKTYSMGTSFDNGIHREQQGIVPRFISDLYQQMEAQKSQSPDFQYQVSVSFLELYNEDLIDLLNRQPNQRRRSALGMPTPDAIEVSIREDVFGNIYWSGVREEPCADPEELLRYVALQEPLHVEIRTFVAYIPVKACCRRAHCVEPQVQPI
jgi:hypothetical protein